MRRAETGEDIEERQARREERRLQPERRVMLESFTACCLSH